MFLKEQMASVRGNWSLCHPFTWCSFNKCRPYNVLPSLGAWDTKAVPMQMHLSLLHHRLLLASEASGTDLLFMNSKGESVLSGWIPPTFSWGCGES